MTETAIQTLDLRNPISRLCLALPNGKGWTSDTSIETEKWYKRFLELAVMNPHVVLVPTHEIDELWHMHVLDMHNYEKDMNCIFGKQFYHEPVFDGRDLTVEFEQTQKLFLDTYGEMPPTTAGYKPASCNSGSDSDFN